MVSRRRKIKRDRAKAKDHGYLNDEYAAVAEAFAVQNDDFSTKKRRKGKKMKLPYSITGSGQGNGTYSYSGGHESHVHKGDKIIFEADGKKLYAGNGRGVDEFSGAWDLIIDLANNISTQQHFGFIKEHSTKKYEVLRNRLPQQKKIQSELLLLAWPDMQPAPVGLDFWADLWKMLPEKTVAMCIGGHGRTGTCLASLMIASGEMDYYEAVNHVRTEHCQRAIETLGQELYLYHMYVELLERSIEYYAQHGPKGDLIDFTEALAYAKAHVPNNASSFGTKPEKKVVQVQGMSPSGGSKSTNHSKPASAFKPTADEIAAFANGDDRLKLVGQVIYALECRWPACTMGNNCVNDDHLGWAVWEGMNDMAMSH